jgi:hypothetical protein
MSLFADYVKAAVSALKASAALTAIVPSARIAETIADNADYPNIYIEPGSLRDWSTKTENGVEAEFTVNIGSRYNGTLQARNIGEEVFKALHFATLTLDSGQAVVAMHDNTTFITDQDGVTRRCIMRFKINVSED